MRSFAIKCITYALLTTGSVVAEKPNIVFILADDLGIGDVKCYHEPSRVKTPHIDKLAVQGMRFTQAYAPCAVCAPSRYALMTGTYPCRGPYRSNAGIHRQGLTIDPAMTTLPSFLKAQGYRTAQIGKWHLGYGKTAITNWAGDLRPGANEIGFDYHFAIPENHNDNFKTYAENHKLLWIKPGVTELPGKPTKDDLTQVRLDDEVDSTLTSKAIDFIRENRDKPFFVYLCLVAVHSHVTPQVKFRGTSEIGQLGDYIHEMDYHVGEVMATLEELGLTENTILIFAGDNGGQLKDWHTAGLNLDLKDESQDVAAKSKTAKTDARTKFGHRSNADLRGAKGTTFEGGFRVPFIVRWPGKIAPGSESEQVITLADMLATTAGILGRELPESAAGDSFDFHPVLLGKQEPEIRPIILQDGYGVLAFRHGDWKLRFGKTPKWQGEQVELPETAFNLYNLKTDPGEMNDLSAAQPERAKEMREHLLQLLRKGRSR